MGAADDKVTPLIIGHEWAVELLQRGLESGRLSHAYLFAGSPHVGKTSLALYLARALNCLDPEIRPCGSCGACRKIGSGLHPDVRVIDEPGSSLKIDQIRLLQKEMSLAPFEGRWRVYVLCDFQQATLEAANCLLKTLEEPPPKVVLILTATQVGLLLPTIVSRCQVFNLRPLPVAQVQKALQVHWAMEPREANLVASLSEGRVGWAIEARNDDTLLLNREKCFVALEQVLRQERTGRMKLAEQLSQNRSLLLDVFDLWQSWWRDLLLTKSGNVHALTNIDRKQTVINEAKRFTCSEILFSLRSIRDAAQQVEQNVNPRLALDVLFLKMPYPTEEG